MFILTLQDRTGNELKEGDLVKISDGKRITFYSEVKFLEEEQAIAPFHTFSFHSVEKVASLPEGAILAKEERYKIWYLPGLGDEDVTDESRKYLSSWRECEYRLENRSWKITKNEK